MAFVAKMRNRIIGLLIIFTLILIIFPIIMTSNDKTKKNNELIAINHEGAITDEDGQIMAAQEPDYSRMLEPVDDTRPAAPGGSYSKSQDFAGSSETLYASSSTGPAHRNDGAEILGAPGSSAPPLRPAAPPRGQPETLTARSSAPAQKAEVLTAPKEAKKQPVKKETPKAVAKSEPVKPAKNAAAQKGGFTVQVGVFSVAANANKIAGTLKSNGITANVQKDKINNKDMYRVYAGSASSRGELEGLVKKIKQVANVDGKIVAK